VSHISHHLSRTSKSYGHQQIHNPGAAFPFEIPVWNSQLVAQEFQMGGAWDRLYFYHLDTDSSGGLENHHGNQAIKNPA
jgi:hypothetical protein